MVVAVTTVVVVVTTVVVFLIAVVVFLIAVLRILVVAVGVERIRVLGGVRAETRRQVRAVALFALHAAVDTFRRTRHRIILTFGDHGDARVVAVVEDATRVRIARLRVVRTALRGEFRARVDARRPIIAHRLTDVRDVRHERTTRDSLRREASPRDASSRRRPGPLATKQLRFSPHRHRPRTREHRRDGDRRDHSLRSALSSSFFIVRSRHRRRQSTVSSFRFDSMRCVKLLQHPVSL